MRRVTINPRNVQASLTEFERASAENDIVEMAQNFSVSGAYTPTYSLNVTTPTAANIAAVLATMIDMFKKGGLNRTT